MPVRVLPRQPTGPEQMIQAFRQQFQAGQERGLERRRLEVAEKGAEATIKYRQETLKQSALKAAYDAAGDRMSQYLENIDDPSSDESIAAAELIYEQTFDNVVKTFGFPDITYRDVTPEPKEIKEEKAKRPPLPGVFPQARAAVGALPPTTPVPERVGVAARAGLGEVAQAAGRIPSQALGLGATGYNILAQTTAGLTGMPQPTVPQPVLEMMRRGQLFEKPLENLRVSGEAFGEGFKYAGDYYKRVIQRIMRGQGVK